MPSDLTSVSNMGRILDNSRSTYHPLTIFNTSTLQLFEYQEKLQSFKQLTIKDDSNLMTKFPKNFKSVYLGNEYETYFIAGGINPKSNKASKSAYLLEKDQLTQVRDMRMSRINFAMATLKESKRISHQVVNVYCIGGYSVKEGRAMKEVEMYSMETKDWMNVAEMNIARINAGACSTGQRFIYVFGGRSQGEEFYDTIERYNVELNIWSVLRVTMPIGLCNLYCFTFLKEDRIVILGGLKKKVMKNKI